MDDWVFFKSSHFTWSTTISRFIILRNKWVYITKYAAYCFVNKHKACLVAKRLFLHVEGIYYSKITSSQYIWWTRRLLFYVVICSNGHYTISNQFLYLKGICFYYLVHFDYIVYMKLWIGSNLSNCGMECFTPLNNMLNS